MTGPVDSGPVTAVVVGAGVRGRIYADYAREHPDRLRVVAVAEPRADRRERLAEEHGLAGEAVLDGWQELARLPRLADAAIIATQDGDHVGPAKALAGLGYSLLIEKPVAPTLESCEEVLDAVRRIGVVTAVCHVLRYTPYTRALVESVRSGVVGDVVSVEHLEPVGFWHMAHSYVRGNWRRSDEASSMLLAKSSHDLDWIAHVVDRACVSVASFGSLQHFRRSSKPAEAGEALRCFDCAYEPSCPFSAPRFYLGRLAAGDAGWPVDVVADPATESSVVEALRTGPYGRCVYECDNDVVDHQVVAMTFEGGATATFTMTGLSEAGHRRTRIFGTRGELRGDGETIERYDYLTGETVRLDVGAADPTLAGGHGGGDDGLMDAFVAAVAAGDPSLVLSDLETSVATHRLVFAAEKARRENAVVVLADDL